MTNNLPKIAGITNVGICVSTLGRIVNRSAHLPGMAVFAGPSGYGKSIAAAYAANQSQAYYLECRSTWTRKDFLVALGREMRQDPLRTTSQMLDRVAEELILSRRPLIIDEFDYVVEKTYVNIVRDLYEMSQAPILLIGEEKMPQKLKRWERFDGRILEIAQAQPVSMNDAKQLAAIYLRGVNIAEDLLAAVHAASKGSARRVSVNLDNIREHCVTRAIDHIALADWKNGFFTGDAPRRGGV
jgi:hypothetical protein